MELDFKQIKPSTKIYSNQKYLTETLILETALRAEKSAKKDFLSSIKKTKKNLII